MEKAIRRISIPRIGSEVYVYFIGDTHIGGATTDERALMHAVEMIKEDHAKNPNTYVVYMGDYCDFITHTGDRRFDVLELLKTYNARDLRDLPTKQADRFLQFMEPIKELSLAIIIGNHEDTYIRHNTHDIYAYIREGLNNPADLKRFGFLRLVLVPSEGASSKAKFDFVLRHGGGGGAGYTEGWPINKVIKAFNGQEGDIHVMGHIHKITAGEVPYIRLGQYGTSFETGSRWYAVNGTFQKSYVEGETNYSEAKGGRPIMPGMLKVTLSYRFTGRTIKGNRKRHIKKNIKVEIIRP